MMNENSHPRYCHVCESVFHADPELHGSRYHPGEVWKYD